ncbi:TLG2 (YOL018C) [Zygosaccharomyces parabailii]|uniref:ZYBA0S13-02080g1_1 n=1 Tax=Zygosaccharomyces bailii (strain CLIB 213 / ATCC 58445 / CBS 680 / BCRC 21525 / NBRC 1098 / NCYC 1416 / NRRL Y-2227) TaxID=1333698 RepID=A0A8J2XAT8_ZYGB2|nr:TLG2 (YOL018C) [Zygosaccharomyces parabailii]CDF91722.1 ZYBA0S13-02080g1_1 [Zygosaccharomyces bailii CLIB 213]CDH12331.1 related to T-SNARE affecting a late Golgi compartment protein 2 [Zygosaccharomyces bailii ISA1307]
MFRDRTNLFLSYRRTFPHNAKFSSSRQSQEDPFLDDEEAFPMQELAIKGSEALPPSFVDLTQDVDENLDEVDRLMVQLSKLYRKNALPGFEDKSHDEKEIESLSFQLIQLFQRCYNVMKNLQVIDEEQQYGGRSLQRDDLVILENLRKRYAQKIQVQSNKFRVLQNNYLKFLNKDDSKPVFPKSEGTSQLLLEEEEVERGQNRDIEAYSRQTLQKQKSANEQATQQFLRERDEEITQLAKGVLEVSVIFREMQELIIDQGTIVDRIDYNLENTVIDLKSADRELKQATRYQKSTQKCKVIFLLTLCVVALFMFVMLKPHGGSKTVKVHTEAPAPALPQEMPTRPQAPPEAPKPEAPNAEPAPLDDGT